MKYIRFFVLNASFRMRFIVIAGLFLALVIEFRMLKSSSAQLEQSRAEYALVSGKSEMEAKIFSRTNTSETLVPSDDEFKKYALEGTGITDGIMYAVINGGVYKIGDPVDNFQVQSIAMDKVVLVNPAMGGTRTLFFRNTGIDIPIK